MRCIVFVADFFKGPARADALGPFAHDIAAAGEIIVFFDQQPIVFRAAVARPPDANESPSAAQLVAEKLKFEFALAPTRQWIAGRNPVAAVPNDHLAGAVFAGGNGAFERAVVERMIFDFHRQAALLRIVARPFGHRPTGEHAGHLEPQIVVQPARRVLVHHKRRPRLGLSNNLAARLGRLAEIALAAVGLECHGGENQRE